MSTNDITGDRVVTKAASAEYLNNYDRIFRQRPKDDKQPSIEDESMNQIKHMEKLHHGSGNR